jgi:hypothetical protein
MMLIRGKIAKFSTRKLNLYLDKKVFTLGYLTFLPLVVFSVDATNCVFGEDVDPPDNLNCTDLKGHDIQCDGIYYHCGAYLYSQFSIRLLVSSFLGVALFISPLTYNNAPCIETIRLFSPLPTKSKIQLSQS